MKIIKLLNKIAKGEEVPNKIKYSDREFDFIGGAYEDIDGKDLCYYDYSCSAFLNDEVEILEEEKKIPEEINWKEKESMAGNLTKDEQIEVIARRTEHLKKSINEILNYLEEIE